MAQDDSSLIDVTYVVNPALEIVYCGEDEVLVLHGTRSDFRRVINDDGKTRILSRVLREMHTPASLADLNEQGVLSDDVMDDAENLLEYLVDENVLVDPEANLTTVYLETLNGTPSPLSERTVGFVGAGHLGARVIDELARLDVGRIIVMDDRVVETPEIDRRQFGPLAPTVEDGKAYVDCVADHLDRIGYEGEVVTQEAAYDETDTLRAVVEASDFVVAATEVFVSRLFHTVDEATLDIGRPWMSVYLDGSEAAIGPLYVPGDTCCYNEFEVQSEAALAISQTDYYTYKEQASREGLSVNRLVLPAHFSATAGLAAGAVTSFLGYQQSFLVGSAMRINFEQMSVSRDEVLKLPRTPRTADTRQGYRHIFM